MKMTIESVVSLLFLQDNLRKYGTKISEILLEKNGVMYVCGDSANMGKDVRECIRDEIVKKKGKYTNNCA